jgi:hypothetical protein
MDACSKVTVSKEDDVVYLLLQKIQTNRQWDDGGNIGLLGSNKRVGQLFEFKRRTVFRKHALLDCQYAE